MNRQQVSIFSSWNLALKVWGREFLLFRKSILISVFWVFFEPLFYLIALGYGLGAYVSNINGSSYVEFFFPALLCTSSMMVSFFVSTYDNFSKLTHQKIFETQMLTPIEPFDIIIGEVLWGATKGTISAISISIIAYGFGLIQSWTIFPCLVVLFLSSAVFSAMGIVVTTLVRNFDQIIYPTSGLIIPMSLFCGTYFPIEGLPFGLNYVTLIFPLTHSVKIVRSLLMEQFSPFLLLNLLYLLGLLYLLLRIANKRLSAKLLN